MLPYGRLQYHLQRIRVTKSGLDQIRPLNSTTSLQKIKIDKHINDTIVGEGKIYVHTHTHTRIYCIEFVYFKTLC